MKGEERRRRRRRGDLLLRQSFPLKVQDFMKEENSCPSKQNRITKKFGSAMLILYHH